MQKLLTKRCPRDNAPGKDTRNLDDENTALFVFKSNGHAFIDDGRRSLESGLKAAACIAQIFNIALHRCAISMDIENG